MTRNAIASLALMLAFASIIVGRTASSVKPDLESGTVVAFLVSKDEDVLSRGTTCSLRATFEGGRVVERSASGNEGALSSSLALDFARALRDAALDVSAIPEVGAVRVFIPDSLKVKEIKTSGYKVVHERGTHDPIATIGSGR